MAKSSQWTFILCFLNPFSPFLSKSKVSQCCFVLNNWSVWVFQELSSLKLSIFVFLCLCLFVYLCILFSRCCLVRNVTVVINLKRLQPLTSQHFWYWNIFSFLFVKILKCTVAPFWLNTPFNYLLTIISAQVGGLLGLVIGSVVIQ